MKCKNCNENDAIKYSKYSSGEFCSRKCARSYSTLNDNNIKKIINCSSCGDEIEVDKRSDPKRTKCKKCKNQFKKKRSNGHSGKREIRICKNCEKEFKCLSIKIRQGGGIFCSKECHYDYMKSKKRNEKERKYWNILYQKKCKYNLSEKEYLDLISMKECMICGRYLGEGMNKFKCIDHDHENNRIRGILCHSCNRGLGFFHDSPEFLKKAIEYLAM